MSPEPARADKPASTIDLWLPHPVLSLLLAASALAEANAPGWPIWNIGAKSISPAWRWIASVIFGWQCPALTHHSPAVPSSIWRPSSLV